MLLAIVLCGVGVGFLAFAPDRFVAGAAGLADHWGMSRVMVGVLIVGFGTSAPEMLVSGLAAAQGDAGVGAGNVVGSNIANLSLILGVAALIATLSVPRGIIRVELPLVVVSTVVFALVVQNGVTFTEGVILLVLMSAVLWFLVWRTRHPDADDESLGSEVGELLGPDEARGMRHLIVLAGGGLVGTLVGAQLLVTGAVDIAEEVGLSGGFVGMTLVAFGTSLPELVTAVAAARAGEDRIILGNLMGSNLFNSLAVAGVMGLAGGGAITDASLTVGGVVLMLVVTGAAAVFMITGRLVNRWEALGLLGIYALVMPLLAGV
jgi:cation:H+ antiporter